MLILLEIILGSLIGGSIVFYVACAFYTLRFFRFTASVPKPSKAALAGVSILVPVCGLDAGAWENWSSLCTQNYPNYEVLFGVMEPADPAVLLLQKLVSVFPHTRLFTGLEPRGLNHKDSNLSYLVEESQYDLLILSDSDIQVCPDYAYTVTQPLADPQVGLVTCAFAAHHPQFLGSALASSGRCFDFIPSLLVAQAVDGVCYAVGATIATRKETLADLGGLRFNYVGSDYELGKRAVDSGYRVELSHEVLESDTKGEGIAQVFQRELRWARTIRCTHGRAYYGMVFCFGTVYCLPLLWLTNWAEWAIVLTSVTLLVRGIQVLVSLFSVKCFGLWRWLWLLPLRDSLSFVVWSVGAFGNRVYWRGRWLRLIDEAQPN